MLGFEDVEMVTKASLGFLWLMMQADILFGYPLISRLGYQSLVPMYVFLLLFQILLPSFLLIPI